MLRNRDLLGCFGADKGGGLSVTTDYHTGVRKAGGGIAAERRCNCLPTARCLASMVGSSGYGGVLSADLLGDRRTGNGAGLDGVGGVAFWADGVGVELVLVGLG